MPDYDGRMGLALVVGPAKAGKIARLLEGYLEVIEHDPVLIVPGGADVERIERDLLARTGALLAGSIGTFDDVFRELALADPSAKPVASDAQRALVARRALARTPLNGLGRSSRFAGFADSLLSVLAELESGLLDPAQLDGDLAVLYASYRAELDRLGLWDRDLLRRRAVERLRSELEAWDGRPVFAYGFEDLTGVEWGLLEALTARAEVTVSLPYEPGRAAFASLRRTQEDLASLAGGSIEDLPARSAEYGHDALAHLERHLFADTPPGGPVLDGAVRFFEGAGARGSLELVAEDVRELADGGVPLDEIALVVPSVERWRAPLETVLGTLGIPFAIEGRVRLGQTAFGQALLSLLRFEWQLGGRRELYAFLRSPYSGFIRSNVDFLEGRLRGAAQRRRSGRGGSRDCGGDAAECTRARRATGRRREPGRPALVRVADAGPRRAGRLAGARR
jgi:ATP-dependent helicase/DNAse subunit B